ncbi:SDR family oxidoreductase [Arthrobacter sp. UYCu712]|uniref:SDR family NAD(P)-dependent oxidoreductase n=1 Tax=Arthrobacter sp. UYCu712 TaxID=3156340 RepID=UPI0033919AEC
MEFDELVAVNLAGFFHVSQRAVALKEAAGSGHITNITTTLADQPSTDVPAMLAALTKGGLNSATKSLATEYASRGIRVNSVSPGVIKTPMHPVETHAQLAGLHPMGRLGDIDEIVHAVVFLEETEFVTGEILHVDGGQHAGR